MALTRRTILCALSPLALAACSTTQSIRPVEREPMAFSPWSDIAPAYRLGVGDRIRVDFLMTPEGLELAGIFPRITRPAVRRRILDLVRSMADEDAEGEAFR